LSLTESLPTKELTHPEPFNSDNRTNGSCDSQDPVIPLTVDHVTTRIGLQTDEKKEALGLTPKQHSKTKCQSFDSYLIKQFQEILVK
jgi:hypothetical protein